MESGFLQLHIAGKVARQKQRVNSGHGVGPRNDLCALCVSGGFSTGNVDAVLRIPCGILAVRGVQAISSVVFGGYKTHLCDHRLVLGKLRSDPHAAVVGIASKTEKIVDDLLRHRKSEGRVRKHALRFINALDLLCLRGKEA